MKILWVSDAPWLSTGYGVQTRLFVPRLQALGHEVAVGCTGGLDGATLRWSGYTLYPRGRDVHSQDVIAAHSRDARADVTITLRDCWPYNPRTFRGLRWCPWLPVDADPLPEAVRTVVQAAAFRPIVFSRFGERVAEEAGIGVRYVPLGVDCNVFKPHDRGDARRTLGLPADRWIAGIVADNKDEHDRKAFVAQLTGFATFRETHPDALLYLHSNVGVDGRGLDLPAICEALGLGWAMTPDVPGSDVGVLFCDQYRKYSGHPEREMVEVYAALDVLLAASSWEAFGVPLLEAQACHRPVITSDWTSMSELCFAGWTIDEDDSDRRADPVRGLVRHPRPGAIVDALATAYAAPALTEADYRLAQDYDADAIAREHWQPVLAEIAERIAATPKSFAEVIAE